MMMVTFDFMYVHSTLRVSGPYHLVAALRPEFLWAMTIVWPDSFAVVFHHRSQCVYSYMGHTRTVTKSQNFGAMAFFRFSFWGNTHYLLCPQLLGLLRAIVIKMTQAVSTIHRLNMVSGTGFKDPSDEIPFGGSNRSNYSSK